MWDMHHIDMVAMDDSIADKIENSAIVLNDSGVRT
jgi:hypothetical protein